MKVKLVSGILVAGGVAALIAVLVGISSSGGGHVDGGLPAAFGVLVAAAIGVVTVLTALVVALLPITGKPRAPAGEADRADDGSAPKHDLGDRAEERGAGGGK